MDTTIVLAVLGIYMVVSGLTMLFKRQTFPMVIKDLFAHPALLWLIGFFLIYIGGILAFGSASSPWVIVLGWMVVLKGALYIFAPEVLSSMVKKPPKQAIIASGIIVALIGAAILCTVLP